MNYFFIFYVPIAFSSFVSCPTVIQQNCNRKHDPVCAFDQHEKVTQQYMNACEACKVSNTLYYYQGECQQLINYNKIGRLTVESNESSDIIIDCDENTRYLSDCINKEDTVCGVFTVTENCTTCQLEYYNSCIACANSKVDYYYYGYCKNEQLKQQLIYCPADRPSKCSEIKQTVCSQITSPCTTSDCTVESSSWCEACSNSQVISYYQGSCQQYLEYSKNINIMDEVIQKCSSNQPESCTDTVQEVCATETCNDDGSTCLTTYINSCQACQNPKVISYLPFSCFEQRLVILLLIIDILLL